MIFDFNLKNKPMFLKVLLTFFACFHFSVYGTKKLTAPYVSFNLEKNWSCKFFGVDWVCHHRWQRGAEPTLILVTAKIGTSTSSIEAYVQMFEQKNQLEVQKTKKVFVNGHKWIDSIQRQTNIRRNYLSRYVATVCCDKIPEKVHIFIGFYAHTENWTKYAHEFLKALKSLKLPSNLKESLSLIRNQTKQDKQEMISYIDKILSEPDLEEDQPLKRTSPSFLKKTFLLILILLLLGGSYYTFSYGRKKFRRKRRRQKYK